MFFYGERTSLFRTGSMPTLLWEAQYTDTKDNIVMLYCQRDMLLTCSVHVRYNSATVHRSFCTDGLGERVLGINATCARYGARERSLQRNKSSIMVFWLPLWIDCVDDCPACSKTSQSFSSSFLCWAFSLLAFSY